MQAAAQLQATIELLTDIAETGLPADRCMAMYFKQRRYIGSKDKGVISEYFYTVLRNRLSLSYVVEEADGIVSPRLLCAAMLVRKGESAVELFNDERYSPQQLSNSEKAIVSKFDFSVLKQAPQHVQLNVPGWLAPKFEAALGAHYDSEMAAMNERAHTDIRVNTLRSTIAQVTHMLKQFDYNVVQTPASPWGLRFEQRVALFGLDIFKQGWFEVQDEGSQLLALVTGVGAGQNVVDFCAGAGGKTLAMAAMMQNKGTLHACDIHSRRLQELSKRVKRAGAHNVRVHTLSTEHDKWVKKHKETADVVLIDAPCTGTGTWRRSPDSRWNLTAESLEALQTTQASILQSASRLVKPGGQLFYATCSLLLEENEQQIAKFLTDNEQFEYGKLALDDDALQSDVYEASTHQLRTFPKRSNMDGFFVCALRKKE